MKDLQLEYLKKELSKHDLKQPNPALDDAILKGGVRLQRLAVFKYNVVTKVGSFDINDTTTPAL